MKDVEEKCNSAEEITGKEKKLVNSNYKYETSVIADETASTWNGGGEPSSKQDGERIGQVSSERGKGKVTRDAHEKEVDDEWFGRRSVAGSRHSNKAKANRRLYNDGRKSTERHLTRAGRKRKHFEDRGDDYIQSEDNLSDDDDLWEQSGSDMSDVSRSHSPPYGSAENMRTNNWSWRPRYHDTRYNDDRFKKATKRRSFQRASYEREMPDYNPLIREMGRFYQMHSPLSSLELRFDDMVSQLLHRQDMMLVKLDTIVTLFHKTVKVLTSPQNQTETGLSNEKESRSLQEHEVRPSAKRSRENLSDTELHRDYTGCRENNNAPHMQYTCSSEKGRNSQVNKKQRGTMGLYGSHDVGTNTAPEVVRSASHDAVRMEVSDQLPPRISSYYSVRRNSAELFGPEEYCEAGKDKEGGQERRLVAAYGNGQSSSFGQPIKRRSWGEYGTGTAEAENNVGRERSRTVNNIGMDEKLKESTSEPIMHASERHFVNEGDRITYSSATEYNEDKAQTDDVKRSLNVNERPSMVDLSQTSNMMLSKKFYASSSDTFAGSGSGVEIVDTRDRPGYEEGTVSCVYTRHGWQNAKKALDTLLQPSSYRKRDSSEYKTWLARTFTTGSGHSEDFPRSMVTKGHEARGANHSGDKSSLTDNKKMMSSIAHLIMSSIDVSSEIVQILVATPSDNNSNKDHSRKSMECLLNQSLAIMGCLPLIAEIDLSVVQKIYQSSKNCMSFIYRLMDHCYTREELMRCRVAGGVRRYRGNNTETEQLCPKRLRTVLKLASDLFPNEYIKLSKANMIRNNINMKCRKTVIRDIVN